MAMKRAYEFLVHAEDKIKIRIVSTAHLGEYRDGFRKRSDRAASVVLSALNDHYGPLNVEKV